MAKINEVSSRFLQAFEDLKKSGRVSGLSDFANKIGVSSSMLTEIHKKRSNVGLKAVQNTVNKFPDFSADWFLTGNGKMNSFKIPGLTKDLEVGS